MKRSSMDLSGTTEVKMESRRGWQGSYYVDDSGECIFKTCSSCKNTRPVYEFTRDSAKKYGYASRCKACAHKVIAEYRKTPEARDREKKSNQEYLSRMYQRTDQQVLMDRERTRPTGYKICTTCGENRPLSGFTKHRRYLDGLSPICQPCVRERDNERKRTRSTRAWMRRGIPLECYVCGHDWEQSDHVVPASLGGSHTVENRLPLCAEHNRDKSDTPLVEWLWSRPDLEQYGSRHEILLRVLSYGVWPIP